jgi:glycosyltransferase involved in cell wall biosynthesis
LTTLIFTVTNDLSYDQRMQRICTSLATNGYDVLLVGRKKYASIPLNNQPFRQKRLNCLFQKGPAFYIEYNFRLFFYLLFLKMDVICAIDLDTILPCYFVSIVRTKQRVYDAHELFTEMKEIVERPSVLKMWRSIERFTVPKFRNGYTVNQSLVDELNRRYGVNYKVVRNLPVMQITRYVENNEQGTRNIEQGTVNQQQGTNNEKRETRNGFIIYQGAVNEGRSFETIIPAMKNVNAQLLIYGEGNFFEQTKQLIQQHGLVDKVILKGVVPPEELKSITPTAHIAIMIFEATGMNQYHSLSNRFFDYIMAGVPQVCVNYPEYKAINDTYEIAVMIDDVQPETIAAAINQLLDDDVLHERLHQNCLKAREALNWSSEEKKLVAIYNNFTQRK